LSAAISPVRGSAGAGRMGQHRRMRDDEADTGAVWAKLHATHLLVLKALERALLPVGVSPQQALALVAVSDAGGRLQPGELADALAQESQSVTGLIDRMEAQGWVRRVRDLADRRALRVELLPAGEAVLGDAVDAINLALDAILADVNPAEAEEFLTLLRRLGQRAEE
jgi:DNA-binding MarR family transcriptional regulator